jgi:hypothetical protein
MQIKICYCQVSKYPGYPTEGKKWHPTRLLHRPIVGDPKSTDSMSATQCAKRQTLSRSSLAERPRARYASRATPLRLARAPAASSKAPDPPRHVFHLARGARYSLRRWDKRDHAQSTGARKPRPDST